MSIVCKNLPNTVSNFSYEKLRKFSLKYTNKLKTTYTELCLLTFYHFPCETIPSHINLKLLCHRSAKYNCARIEIRLKGAGGCRNATKWNIVLYNFTKGKINIVFQFYYHNTNRKARRGGRRRRDEMYFLDGCHVI